MRTDTLSLLAPEAGAGERARTFLFLVVDGDCPGAALRIDLEQIDALEMGRGQATGLEGARLLLDDRRVSARHARIEPRNERFWLVDAGSKNGTRLREQCVAEAPLKDGDWIEIGHAALWFRVMPGPVGHVRADPTDALSTLHPGLAGDHEALHRVAATTTPVLLLGPTGTGKEVYARALHDWSGRRGAFQAVNCAALPPGLLESELFGHVRGAFSGASADRLGHLRSADGGTLFLDELGELPPAAQAALLRATQEHAVVPVGASRPVPVSLRLVGATNRPLVAAVGQGHFRDDLFARLAGLSVTLPPLGDRRMDLGLLLARLGERLAPGRPPRWSIEAMRLLLSYRWPRNVRELERCLETCLALAGKAPIEAAHVRRALQPDAQEAPPTSGREGELRRLLGEHRGNVAAVARALGKAPTQIRRWIAQHAIDVEAYRK